MMEENIISPMNFLRTSVYGENIRKVCWINCPCCGEQANINLRSFSQDAKGDVHLHYQGSCNTCGFILDIKGNTW